MLKIFKKIFLKKDDSATAQKAEDKPSIVDQIQDKTQGVFKFFQEKIEETKNEFGDVRAKVSNLLDTNYQLGLKHLEKGNISDAVFRFRFIKKFWPECFDAHYQLAYALVLHKKPFEAKSILQELLIKKPDYDQKARDLLDQINNEKAV